VKTKKLLLTGSTINPVHLRNYYFLVRDYFDEVLIVGTHKVDFCESVTLNFSLKNPLSIMKSIKSLKKIMSDFKPSVIHAHQANSVGFITSLANKKKIPQVITTWGDDVLIFPKKNFVFRMLARISLNYSHAITADAQIMKTAIEEFVGRKDVVVANFGIDIDQIEPVAKENIIYSNRLHDPLYNIDQLILGVKEFLKKNTSWKLIIAGNGSMTEYLKELAEQNLPAESYEFVGFVSSEKNQSNFLKSTIFISIPNTDGTAISLLEAMAFGCLPILSDLPANKEWVTDGVNGIIVKDKNLSNALNQAMTIDRSKVQEINHSIIVKRATKQANRSLFYAIYDNLLKDK